MENQSKPAPLTLEALGGKRLPGNAITYKGWHFQAKKGSILNGMDVSRWEKELGVFRLPEMVFGENVLEIKHEASGISFHFNAWDALNDWTKENLPPVKVPAAVQWRNKTKSGLEVVIDYDYTFTTNYKGSLNSASQQADENNSWEKSDVGIDWEMLQEKDPILFYDEVLLYEDELADCGTSFCSVKVLRVDGVLVRLRDTRIFSKLGEDSTESPLVVRECFTQEYTFQELATRGLHVENLINVEPNAVCQLGGTKVIEKLSAVW